MDRPEQAIEIKNSYGDEGTYLGEVAGAGHSRCRHGRGVMAYRNGERYQGDWRKDRRSGRGVFTRADGARYDGEFDDGWIHGRGAYLFADGRRLYDGAWAGHYPVGGAALDGDGAVWRAACDG